MRKDRKYNWKRFWHPVGDEAQLRLWDGGFLEDPEHPTLPGAPELRTIEELAERCCVVLLGEPGMGKSRALRQASSELKRRCAHSDDKVLEVDLKGARSEDDVRRIIVDNDIFTDWNTGQHRMHLLVDSIDECLLRLDRLDLLLAKLFREHFGRIVFQRDEFERLKLQHPTLVNLPPHAVDRLRNEIRIDVTQLSQDERNQLDAPTKQALASRLPTFRLRLLLACRTADWQTSFHSLENLLSELWWADESPSVNVLAPLRRVDVEAATLQRGLNPSAFISEVDRVAAVPLAIKPVTLDFLLDQFESRKSGLPATQVELYEQGCRHLCEETEKPRERMRKLDAARRLAVAARIAALSVFSGRSTISTSPEGATSDSIQPQDIAGYRETVTGNELEVDESSIEEALSTAMFASAGESRLRWAHQTYAEFLAAYYLIKQKRVGPQRIFEFILHAHDTERRVVPQLREVAAWMAAMDRTTLRVLLERDPLVLLRSDITTADEEVRAKLLDTLLRLHDEKKLIFTYSGTTRDYQRLNHVGIINKLHSYITDRSRDEDARRLAIAISEAIESRELQADLVKIALESTESHMVRVDATLALTHTGHNDFVQALKPLLDDETKSDPDNRLKGIAMEELWERKLISAKDLLHCYTPPKRRDHIGKYHVFINKDLFWGQLTLDELKDSLYWLGTEGIWTWEQGLWLETSKLSKPLKQACQHLNHSGMLKAVTTFLCTWLRDRIHVRDEDSVLAAIASDENSRRTILKYFVEQHARSDQETRRILQLDRRELILQQDLQWLIEQIRAQPSGCIRSRWAVLISLVPNYFDTEARDELLDTCLQIPLLARLLGLESIELHSARARKLKAEQAQLRQWEAKLQEQQRNYRPLPSISVRVNSLLKKCEAGESGKWPDIFLELSDRSITWASTRDLRQSAGWSGLAGDLRIRVLSTAKRYILEHGPETELWLGTDNILLPAVAGAIAIRLLLDEGIMPEEIPSETWQKWAPAVIERAHREYAEEAHRSLLLAWPHAPTEVLHTLRVLLDQDCQDGRGVSVAQTVRPIWNAQIAQLFFDKLISGQELTLACMEDLLGVLIEQQHSMARTLADTWLTSERQRPAQQLTNERLAAAVALLKHGRTLSAWNTVWALLQRDPQTGAAVIHKLISFREEHTDWLTHALSEDQLADLYIWLEHQFPSEIAPRSTKRHLRAVTKEHEIDWWRRSLLNNLKQRGTHKTIEAIGRIRRALPHLEHLRWAEWEAREQTNRDTWISFEPAQLLNLLNQADARIVQSPEQLLNVVLESLERLQQQLRGETPSAIFLWDEWRQNKSRLRRPKLEDVVSDFVTSHLRQTLVDRNVVINREVQISRGERTDIHLVASSPEPHEGRDQIGLIIEVKGCWNDKLDTALEEQLVNRYLKNNRGRAGLYLVAWFPQEQWDSTDYRWSDSHRTFEDAKQYFANQAQALSRPGCRVAAFVLDASLRDE